MIKVNYSSGDAIGINQGIEVIDINSLDEVSGGVLPAVIFAPAVLSAAGKGFAVGAAATAALIAGRWAAK